MTTPRTILVLGDQLTRAVGPLSSPDARDATVLMIESDALARSIPHHKQKLVLVFSAMRHFAEALEADGFDVDYRQAESFEAGIAEHLADRPGGHVQVMEPTDWGYADRLRRAASDAGGSLEILPNPLWLTDRDEFDAWAKGRKTLRLEHFYRDVRKRRGWLMDGDQPVGGTWNMDSENRETPDPDHRFPPMPRFEPDALTRSVMDEVADRFPDHFGTLEGFAWPVTRDDALAALDHFLEHRLARFGPFEDAIVERDPVLYHSLLSIPLNLGLLHPLEVCERALERWAGSDGTIPLNSIEGFIRQVLGWREFMRHVYRRLMPGLREANGLEHTDPLPPVYWGAPTRMRCMEHAVARVQEAGHTHHIQRLMILGNLALIAGVDPRELNEWFLACYVDALDWVVTPNVMGMSQYADLGSFTTKPYAAGGNYVRRMSDHCAGCAYDVGETVGEDACPLNSLYWDFIDRHRDRWSGHPRMGLMAKQWAGRDEETRVAIVERAREVRAALQAGEL